MSEMGHQRPKSPGSASDRTGSHSDYQPRASASIATPELSKNTTLEIVARNRGPLQPRAEAPSPSVPDLVLLIVLSCRFYGVTPNRLCLLHVLLPCRRRRGRICHLKAAPSI